VFAALFFPQFNRCTCNTADDPRCVRPSCPFLEGGHSTIAGRLAGAFRNSGRDRIADDITKTMSAAGYDVRENDPFTDKAYLALPARETSPCVNRIRLLWQKMRDAVIGRLPKAPGLPRNISAYMKRVDDAYVTDAYHSLSIEGYRITPGLIEGVRSGAWNPETNEEDLSNCSQKCRQGSAWRKSRLGRR
jgi:hypothetical protein